MQVAIEDFEQYRRLLFAIAYRMVGTAMEAEDIVQDAYLRYRAALMNQSVQIDNLKGFLTTITTRLCLDYLKSAQAQRQSYFGIWLPEPTMGGEALIDDQGGEEVSALRTMPIHDPSLSPADRITQQESISMAFLVILEQLTPVERAVLLLRGVFDYDYAEIAAMVDKSEANVRQIFHRAQAQVRTQRPRFEVAAETHASLVNQFLFAVQQGELDGLLQLLTHDAIFSADGGGKASSAVNKLVDAAKVARFCIGLVTRGTGQYTAVTREINGRLSLLIYTLAGVLDTVFLFDVCVDEDGEATSAKGDSTNARSARICNIYAIRNPDKLARLVYALEK